MLLLCSVGWQSVTGMDLHNGISYCEFYEIVESFQTKEECKNGKISRIGRSVIPYPAPFHFTTGTDTTSYNRGTGWTIDLGGSPGAGLCRRPVPIRRGG